MDYPFAKFGDFCFSRCFIVRTNTHTHTQMLMNALLPDCRRRIGNER